jgi:Zn-dependent M28 family amino/carboxypeptidase
VTLIEEIDGDNIYHGAIDNATGIRGRIEIARAFFNLPNPPKRSILFLAVTAEEGPTRLGILCG